MPEAPRPVRILTPTLARRLAITRQHLAGPPRTTDAGGMLALVKDLGCLQLDPISVVARSHLLVLFSRLGAYDPAMLDTLLWTERTLFEYWAHCASIVPTDDYPLHRPMMDQYATTDANHHRDVRDWVAANDDLRRHILDRLERDGPLQSKDFAAAAVTGWASTGWTGGRNVSRMLDYLWIKGEIMVAGRVRGQKRWDLAERCQPAAGFGAPLPPDDLVSQAAQRSLRALGVARSAHIQQHFLRGRYPGLATVLRDLAAAGRILPVAIHDQSQTWPGPWYIHADDLPLLDRLTDGHWQPRTTLLSPFDNLICDRRRTAQLFDFDFRIEIYTPRTQRRYGYYVLPLLHGDRLIARIDPTFDRRQARLTVNAVHWEPSMPVTTQERRSLTSSVEALAAFLGARTIDYGDG